MNSSVHIDNKNKNILTLRKGPTQGLDNFALTAEEEYSITFTKEGEKNCLSLHCNSYLFVNELKEKDSEIILYPLRKGFQLMKWRKHD